MNERENTPHAYYLYFISLSMHSCTIDVVSYLTRRADQLKCENHERAP